jgi:NTE family protein
MHPVSDRRRVALVLGSGGARGYAHVGVIQAVEARGHEIVALAGSSMGAMVGGVWAAGKMAEYEEWVTGLGQFEVLRLLDLALASSGAIRGEKVFGRVQDLVGDILIEDLPVSFTAVATDLYARKEVWFQRGPLAQAMRASAAMPSLLPPVEWQGRTLVDGGVLNPLPLAPIAAANADLVIAVSLHGEGPRSAERQALESTEPTLALVDRVRSRASRLADREGRSALWTRAGRDAARAAAVSHRTELPAPDESADGPDGPAVDKVDFDVEDMRAAEPAEDGVPTRTRSRARPRQRGVRDAGRALSKFEVVNLSIDTMQAAITRHKLAGYPPDLLVSVPKLACRTLDFHRAADMIALGRQLADQTLDAFDAPFPGTGNGVGPPA